MGTGGVLNGDKLRLGAFACAAALALALGLSACGSGGGSDSSAASTERAASTAPKPEPPEKPEVGTAVSTGLPGVNGQVAVTRVVVNEHGFTLYHFSKDKRNSGKSACYGKCEKLWRPYLTLGKPTVINRAQQPLVGTIRRRDGDLQVTYAGLPLYTYAPDPPAAAEGFHRDSFGGVWLLISRGGKIITGSG